MRKLSILTILLLLPQLHLMGTASPSELQRYYQELQQNPERLHFTPPKDWILLDPAELPTTVSMIATKSVGIGIPPTINLASEPYKGSATDYLNIMRKINEQKGYSWRSLGTMNTLAGTAQLSQRELNGEWGKVRQMHLVLTYQQRAYILTATALQKDFPKYYKEISEAMRSLSPCQK